MRNKNATRKGSGRVHQQGGGRIRKKIAFGDAIREWIRTQNLQMMATRLEKRMANLYR